MTEIIERVCESYRYEGHMRFLILVTPSSCIGLSPLLSQTIQKNIFTKGVKPLHAEYVVNIDSSCKNRGEELPCLFYLYFFRAHIRTRMPKNTLAMNAAATTLCRRIFRSKGKTSCSIFVSHRESLLRMRVRE